MARKGRDLEKLIHSLEQYISKDGVSIESPGLVEDRITSTKREVDVLIRSGEGHHQQIIAIECKDRKTPVGLPDVEAFHTKITDLKSTKAVFVSSSGFRKTALNKAAFYNISCLDLEEVEYFDWLLTDHIISHEDNITKCNWKVSSENPDVEKITNWYVQHKDGVVITEEILIANSKAMVGKLNTTQLEKGKTYSHIFSVNPKDLFIVDRDTGNKLPANECKVYVEFNTTIKELPLKKIKYGDVAEGREIAKGAITEVNFGNFDGHLMMIENEDGSKNIVLTKGNKA